MSIRDRVSVFIDAFARTVSPSWALRREMDRASLRLLDRRSGRGASDRVNDPRAISDLSEDSRLRQYRWGDRYSSPDATLQLDLDKSLLRSTELFTDDCIGGAIDQHVTQVCGLGFSAKSMSDRFSEEILLIWKHWSAKCSVNRRDSLWTITRIAMRSFMTRGEAAIAIVPRVMEDGYPNIALEVIDSQRIETPPSFSADKNVRIGVKYSDGGEILGYYVRNSQPHDLNSGSIEHYFVPASDMLFLIDPWFAVQSRGGFSALSRVANATRDMADLNEAGIVGAQAEACVVGIVQRSLSGQAAASGAATGYTSSGERLQDMSPGRYEYIEPGEQITFNTPSRANSVGTLQEFTTRRISVGVGIPYEVLSNDWRSLSFSGGRIVLQMWKEVIASHKKIVIDALLIPLWQRFVSELVIKKLINISVSEFRQNRIKISDVTFTPPPWQYAINPGEEVDAAIAEIDENLNTKEAYITSRGRDFVAVMEQRQREVEDEQNRGIIPPETTKAVKGASNADNATTGGGK